MMDQIAVNLMPSEENLVSAGVDLQASKPLSEEEIMGGSE
jgi:hypothetical protein